MRADAADALDEVDVLDEGAVLGGLLDAAVVVAELHLGAEDALALEGDVEALRLLEGGVRRTDGDGDPGHVIL